MQILYSAAILGIPGLLMLGLVEHINRVTVRRNLFAGSLFVAGSAWAANVAGMLTPGFAVGLSAPVYQILIYEPSIAIFERSQGRQPRDVSMNFQSGFAADRIFAFAYCGLATFPPFYLSLWLDGRL